MWSARKYIQRVSHILESVAAGLVLLGLILSLIRFVGDFDMFHELLTSADAFREYLERIFTLVIGLEFVEMLCHPDSDNVIEVLIFLIARHMIVGETSPYEDFVSVISVALLCILRRYLREGKKLSHKHKNEKPGDEDA